MPLCSSNAADHEVTMAIIPSPNSRAATPYAGLVLMSEATLPQRTRRVHGREATAKILSKANRLCSSITGKAPQRAPLSGSSSAKLALCGEARAEVLLSANPFCRDKRNETSSYERPKRASTRDVQALMGLTYGNSWQTSGSQNLSEPPPYCQQKGCQLVTVHSARCRL